MSKTTTLTINAIQVKSTNTSYPNATANYVVGRVDSNGNFHTLPDGLDDYSGNAAEDPRAIRPMRQMPKPISVPIAQGTSKETVYAATLAALKAAILTAEGLSSTDTVLGLA